MATSTDRTALPTLEGRTMADLGAQVAALRVENARLRAALLEFTETAVEDADDPCWCASTREIGEDHAEYCLQARVALGAHAKEDV